MTRDISKTNLVCTITIPLVPSRLRNKFKIYCEKRGTNMKKILLSFIEDCVNRDDLKTKNIIKSIKTEINEELLKWKKDNIK